MFNTLDYRHEKAMEAINNYLNKFQGLNHMATNYETKTTKLPLLYIKVNHIVLFCIVFISPWLRNIILYLTFIKWHLILISFASNQDTANNLSLKMFKYKWVVILKMK